MKEIKVSRVLSFRTRGPEEKTWPEREETVRDGIEGDEGGGESGIREPCTDPPVNPGHGQERATPESDGQ